MLEEAHVDALQHLGADLLHHLVAAVDDGHVHFDRVAVVEQLRPRRAKDELERVFLFK